ncbi:MAG: hypothetical protein LUH47_08740 [Clostridiales bacterium]|nr:hypothetical protein [Clostridiales bacterium]
MKKIIKRIALVIAAVLGLAFIAGFCFGVKLFVIGEPVGSGFKGLLCDTVLSGQTLDLYVSTTGSADAYRGIKVKQKDDELYVKARRVLVSSLARSGDFNLSLDIGGINKVYLGDKLIWTEDEEPAE